MVEAQDCTPSLVQFCIAALSSIPLAAVLLILEKTAGGANSSAMQSYAFTWESALTIVLVIPFAEEVIFRAWLLEAWRHLMGSVPALLLTATIFSAVHPLGVIENAFFLLPGLIWGYLWLRYRSIALCTVAHSTYNAIALFLVSAHL